MEGQRMKRRALTLVIAGVAVLVGAMLGRAQSVFPVRFDDPSAVVADADVKGGFVIWTGEITDGTKQMVLPAGTLSTVVAENHGVSVRVGMNPSTGPCTLTSFQRTWNATTSIVLDDVTFALESDGSFSIQRTAGSKTYSIIIRGLWI